MNRTYQYESEIPVGGLYRNEFGALCWKVNYRDGETGEVQDVKIVIESAISFKENERNRYEFVLDISEDVRVDQYYGIMNSLV